MMKKNVKNHLNLQLNYLYDDDFNKIMRYTGENTIEKLIEMLTTIVKEVKDIKTAKNPVSNPIDSQRNRKNPVCRISNKILKTEVNAHKYQYYCEKTDKLLSFAHKKVLKRK